MQNKWVLTNDVSNAIVEKLIQEIGNKKSGEQYIDKNIAKLLIQRGVTSFEEAKCLLLIELAKQLKTKRKF